MTFAAEWMRIAFMQFLSVEGKGVMASKISASGSIMPLEDSNAFWIWWSKTLRIETSWNIPI